MENLQIVLKKLQEENCDAAIVTKEGSEGPYYEIRWKTKSGDEFHIFDNDIAIEEGRIAWFQSNSRDNHLLKTYENNIPFSWEPRTYNPVFGCYCLLLEWYRDHLIFIYQEKHGMYVSAVKDKNVNHFYIRGDEIERKDNLISYPTYESKRDGKVLLIQIPELIELEPISISEAEEKGLVPSDLNRPGDFLSANFKGE